MCSLGFVQSRYFLRTSRTFFSNIFVNPSSLQKYCKDPLYQWLSTWSARFRQLKLQLLLAVECSTIDVILKTSGILHRDAERCVLAARAVGKGSTMHYSYSSAVYEDFSSAGSRFNMYSESVIKVRRSIFIKMGESTVEGGHGQKHGATFCVDSSGSFLCDALC